MVGLRAAVAAFALLQLARGLSEESCEPARMPKQGSNMLQTAHGSPELPKDCVKFFSDHCKMTKLPEPTPKAVSGAFQKCCFAGGYSIRTCEGIASDTIGESAESTVDTRVCTELVDLYAAHVDGPKGAKHQASLMEFALWARRGEANGSRAASLDQVAALKCWLNDVCNSDGGCTPDQNTCNCDALTRHCCEERCSFWR